MKYLTILLTAFAAGALAAPKNAATKAAGYVVPEEILPQREGGGQHTRESERAKAMLTREQMRLP